MYGFVSVFFVLLIFCSTWSLANAGQTSLFAHAQMHCCTVLCTASHGFAVPVQTEFSQATHVLLLLLPQLCALWPVVLKLHGFEKHCRVFP